MWLMALEVACKLPMTSRTRSRWQWCIRRQEDYRPPPLAQEVVGQAVLATRVRWEPMYDACRQLFMTVGA